MPKIAAERKMDNLLVLMADLGRAIVSADRCSLWLIDEDSGELWTKVAHGVSELRIPRDAGFVGYSVKTAEPLLIEDAYKDPRFDRRSDEKTLYRTTSVMTVPLLNSMGRVMGVFQAINKKGESAVFSTQDLERLALTAVYSAKTVESAMLNSELEATQREIIHILGEVSEYRSQETGDHIQRVAEISYMLAKFLKMPDEEVDRIRLAAPMHDLGKVGIPDAILNKRIPKSATTCFAIPSASCFALRPPSPVRTMNAGMVRAIRSGLQARRFLWLGASVLLRTFWTPCRVPVATRNPGPKKKSRKNS